MIKRIQHNDIEIAEKIRSIFQLSYKVEAAILNVTDFPPLKRTLDNYVNSNTEFFGYIKDGELAGVIEIDHNDNFTSIDSLVVHPMFFRQGIARALMEFVFNTFEANLFVVETGLENEPATKLYKNLGFKEVKQWTIEQGIKKIKFERKISN